MRRLRLRLNPLVLLLILLPLFGWSVGFEDTVHKHRTDVLAARSAYALALEGTRTQLAGQLAKVAGDATLVQNLNWHLAHSVKSALDGRLQRGLLDQVTVLDKGCGELGRASRFDKGLAPPCPAPADGGAFWMVGAGGPALGLASPVAGVDGGSAVAVGLVELDSTWLGLHPDLQERLQALGLRFGGLGGTVILREGIDGSGTALASLTSDRWLDHFMETPVGRELAAGEPLVWPCLGAACACALLALLRERARRLSATAALDGFLAWARTLSPSGEFVMPGREARTATGDAKTDLATAKQVIEQALLLKSEASQALTAKRQALEIQLKAKEDELQKHRQRLSELAELDSLAVQLQRTSGAFLQRMDEFHGAAADLVDLADGGLVGQSQALHALLLDWRRGIAERGARKFLRSLSETPASQGAPGDVEGPSQLDEDLERLETMATGVRTVAAEATTKTAGLMATAAFATRLAGLWHGLALKTHEQQTCISLGGAIDEAQGLVLLEPALAGVVFANPAEDLGVAHLPELPKPIWVSALYHIYLALAEQAQGTKATVASRIRQDGDKMLLVVQVTGDGPAAKRGGKLAYHLEVSRSILAPFNMSLSVLPSLDGRFPVVLSWSAAEPYRRQPLPAGERRRPYASASTGQRPLLAGASGLGELLGG